MDNAELDNKHRHGKCTFKKLLSSLSEWIKYRLLFFDLVLNVFKYIFITETFLKINIENTIHASLLYKVHSMFVSQ